MYNKEKGFTYGGLIGAIHTYICKSSLRTMEYKIGIEKEGR